MRHLLRETRVPIYTAVSLHEYVGKHRSVCKHLRAHGLQNRAEPQLGLHSRLSSGGRVALQTR